MFNQQIVLPPLSTTFLSMIPKKKLLELNLDLSLATPKVHKYANEQTFKNSKKVKFSHIVLLFPNFKEYL